MAITEAVEGVEATKVEEGVTKGVVDTSGLLHIRVGAFGGVAGDRL